MVTAGLSIPLSIAAPVVMDFCSASLDPCVGRLSLMASSCRPVSGLSTRSAGFSTRLLSTLAWPEGRVGREGDRLGLISFECLPFSVKCPPSNASRGYCGRVVRGASRPRDCGPPRDPEIWIECPGPLICVASPRLQCPPYFDAKAGCCPAPSQDYPFRGAFWGPQGLKASSFFALCHVEL